MQQLDADDASRIGQAFIDLVPLLGSWQVELQSLVPGEQVVLSLRPTNECMSPANRLLGGVLMTVADLAAGLCAAFADGRERSNLAAFATQEFSCHFVSGGKGPRIDTVATMVRSSKRRAVVSVRCVELDGGESRDLLVGTVGIAFLDAQ